MYAIIKAGSRQYRVQEGDVIDVDRLQADQDNEVTFDQVLAVENDGQLKVGTPYLEGVRAMGRVVRHDRGRKILVFKYKPKTGYRRRQGHRQDFTRVRIERIEA